MLTVWCGVEGPNSGHTVNLGDSIYELFQVPVGFVNPKTRLLIAAGAVVDPRKLLKEIALCGLTPERLGVDENAGIIEEQDIEAEHRLGMRSQFGSTSTGAGHAISRRILRERDFRLAKDVPELAPYVTSVRRETAEAVKAGKRIVVEGTQGFGLSLYQASQWPYRTSRDTTAHSFLGEVGLGVTSFDVIMAIRSFPIRVGGNSGPLPYETTWEEVTHSSGYPYPVLELTTTTKRIRPVAKFDWEIVEEAVAANGTTAIALHGADYLDYRNKGLYTFDQLTVGTQHWIEQIEDHLNVPVRWVGTGPTLRELIDNGSEGVGKRDGSLGELIRD